MRRRSCAGPRARSSSTAPSAERPRPRTRRRSPSPAPTKTSMCTSTSPGGRSSRCCARPARRAGRASSSRSISTEDRDDQVYIYGTAAADTFVAGADGITLDQTSPASELDVLFTWGIDGLLIYGTRRERLPLQRGRRRDGRTGRRLALGGGSRARAGNDTLVGGDNVAFRPGPGDDTMAGQNLADLSLGSCSPGRSRSTSPPEPPAGKATTPSPASTECLAPSSTTS